MKSVAGKTFPSFPAHAQPTILHIWQEAHGGGGGGGGGGGHYVSMMGRLRDIDPLFQGAGEKYRLYS